MMNCKAVIFDLDGTLLDSLADIADAANRVLAGRGYQVHPLDDYKMFVGNGSKTLINRILPESQRRDDIIEACHANFIDDYDQNWHVATKPYPGIMDLIRVLAEKNIKISVVTNKPHRFAGGMVAHFFKGIPFHAVIGQQDGIPKKPHPRQARTAATQMGVEPQDCLFLGDSNVDMETAQRAGMRPIGAGWGFRTPRELMDSGALTVLAHPMELKDLMVP